jgi:hypothetical protein
VFNAWMQAMNLNDNQAWICMNLAKLFLAMPNVAHVEARCGRLPSPPRSSRWF